MSPELLDAILSADRSNSDGIVKRSRTKTIERSKMELSTNMMDRECIQDLCNSNINMNRSTSNCLSLEFERRNKRDNIMESQPLPKRRKIERNKNVMEGNCIKDNILHRTELQNNSKKELLDALRREAETLKQERDRWKTKYMNVAGLLLAAKKCTESVI